MQIQPATATHAHLAQKVERALHVPEADWPSFQVTDQLLLERAIGPEGSTRAFLCYLRHRHCLLEDRLGAGGATREWYVHVGATEYCASLRAWVLTDWFVDVVLDPRGMRFRVADLDDLALVHQPGAVDDALLRQILRSTQALLDCLQRGFTPPELSRLPAFLRELGSHREHLGASPAPLPGSGAARGSHRRRPAALAADRNGRCRQPLTR